MTSEQRKAHKLIWILIAIAVPVFLFFSVKNLDFSEREEATILLNEASKKNALKISENEIVKVFLFEKSIKIIVKSTLKTASAVLYTINKNGKQGNVLGQVSTVGIYDFTIKEKTRGIVIFDSIKQVEITKLIF